MDNSRLTDEKRKDQVRNLALNLSRQAETLWGNQRAMAKIRRFAPDRIEDFWHMWGALDNRLREFLEGRLPWSETREIPGELVLPDAQMRNLVTGEWGPLRCRITDYEYGPDVMSAARAVFLLIFELTQEFEKESGSRE